MINIGFSIGRHIYGLSNDFGNIEISTGIFTKYGKYYIKFIERRISTKENLSQTSLEVSRFFEKERAKFGILDHNRTASK